MQKTVAQDAFPMLLITAAQLWNSGPMAIGVTLVALVAVARRRVQWHFAHLELQRGGVSPPVAPPVLCLRSEQEAVALPPPRIYQLGVV